MIEHRGEAFDNGPCDRPGIEPCCSNFVSRPGSLEIAILHVTSTGGGFVVAKLYGQLREQSEHRAIEWASRAGAHERSYAHRSAAMT